jgi:LmbE family N-acetylglucosaminyl deacetylase
VDAAAITFLGYADGSLAGAWSERWVARKRSDERGPADEIVEDLRGALHAAAPDSIVLPMPMDGHPDHAALNRFTLLAVLAELGNEPEPVLFGYLIHGGPQWPEGGRDPMAFEPPPEGCAGTLFPWTALVLDEPGVRRKAALIAEYRSQAASGSRLFRYAGRDEPFATGQVIHASRSMSPMRPGLRQTERSIEVRVPRGDCVVEPGREGRLRLRFIRAGRIEERVVQFSGRVPSARGGTPGQTLVVESDITVTTGTHSVRLALALDAFRDVPGAVLEVLPQSPERVGPAWLLVWRGAPLRPKVH